MKYSLLLLLFGSGTSLCSMSFDDDFRGPRTPTSPSQADSMCLLGKSSLEGTFYSRSFGVGNTEKGLRDWDNPSIDRCSLPCGYYDTTMEQSFGGSNFSSQSAAAPVDADDGDSDAEGEMFESCHSTFSLDGNEVESFCGGGFSLERDVKGNFFVSFGERGVPEQVSKDKITCAMVDMFGTLHKAPLTAIENAGSTFNTHVASYQRENLLTFLRRGGEVGFKEVDIVADPILVTLSKKCGFLSDNAKILQVTSVFRLLDQFARFDRFGAYQIGSWGKVTWKQNPSEKTLSEITLYPSVSKGDRLLTPFSTDDFQRESRDN